MPHYTAHSREQQA